MKIEIFILLDPSPSERTYMWALNINEEKKLLMLKISDTLELNELSEIMKAIYDENDGRFAAFNRFADLSDLKEIEIDFDAVSSRIHEYRRCISLEHPVKISLFIPQKYICGFSHLYRSMLSDDLFQIEIFDSLDKCAGYLSVDKKLLADAGK